MFVNNNRVYILKKAFTSSILSKVVSFVFQIISLPLLITLLGTSEFGKLAVMMAAVGWINLISGGISPYITRTLSTQKNKSFTYKVISGSRTIIVLGSILSCCIYLLFFSYLESKFNELVYPLTTMFLLSLLSLNFSIAESIRQGNMQQHVNNNFAMLSSLLSIVIIYVIYLLEVNEKFLFQLSVIAIYFPLFLSKLINYLLLDKRYFERGFLFYFVKETKLYKLIFSFMLANLMIQLSVIIVKTFSVFYLASSSVIEVAKMEIVFRFLLISGTFFAAIQMPLWPLISEAKKLNDFDWLNKIKKMLIYGFGSYGLLLFILMFLYGEKVFAIWLGDNAILSRVEIIFASLYFLSISLTQALIITLMGLGKFKIIGRALFVEACVFSIVLIAMKCMYFEVSLVNVIAAMILVRIIAFSILFVPSYRVNYA